MLHLVERRKTGETFSCLRFISFQQQQSIRDRKENLNGTEGGGEDEDAVSSQLLPQVLPLLSFLSAERGNYTQLSSLPNRKEITCSTWSAAESRSKAAMILLHRASLAAQRWRDERTESQMKEGAGRLEAGQHGGSWWERKRTKERSTQGKFGGNITSTNQSWL